MLVHSSAGRQVDLGSDPNLSKLEAFIIRLGIFLIFLVTLGDYVWGKVRPILEPLFR